MRYILLGLWLGLSGLAFGQTNLAGVGGSVLDAQSKPISSARVRLQSKETGAVRETVASSEGLFELSSVQPGEYDLEITAPGFAPATRPVRLEVGQQVRLEVALNVGTAQEKLEVVGQAELLKTSDASLGEVIESKSIKELPLNGRMLLDLALTVPGAHMSHGAQSGDMNPLYWRPGQRSAISVGGSRPNANYFLVDGATNTDPTFNT